MENKFTVNLWPGAGYITFAIEVLASSEEDALTKAVERALAEDISIYGFEDTEEKVNDLLSLYAKEYEEYDDYFEFFTSHLNYHYIGDLNYFVHMDNTKIMKGWGLYENSIPIVEEKEIKKKLYDHIANEYNNMSKEELKKYVLEALWQLSQNTTESDYQDYCEMIYDAVNPEE